MSNKLYTSIPAPRVPRNIFDRSRPNSLSLPFQKTVPTMLEEIIPGDLFKINLETFARLQPLIAPVMNNMKLSNHFFYVPLRTLNKHFSEFMFNNKNGDYTDVLPYTTLGDIYNVVDTMSESSNLYEETANVIRLLDFIGLPFKYSSNTGTAQQFINAWLADSDNQKFSQSSLRVNLLPFVAYTKVWSEYFRDENLQDDPFEYYEADTGDNFMEWTGLTTLTVDIAVNFMQLRPRAWAHDRFTSSLPFAQRGPDVLLPITGQADVTYKDGFLVGQSLPSGLVVKREADYTEEKEGMTIGATSSSNRSYVGGSIRPVASEDIKGAAYDPNGSLEIDFDNSQLTTTINSFRRAERLQRWYENCARGGVRQNEATLAHFGVKTPDSSLDRSEYLGGNMQPIVISEVAQTSETTQDSPQGTLAGKGTSYKSSFGIKRYFTEHGFLFCFTSAIVRANYWQGIPKVFSRMQRDEYYWPEFANLGEEPVYDKELYVDGNTTEDSVFGYVPRYSDYKSAVGECHGDMRSSLNFWTQTREFANKPELNEEFMFAPPSYSPFAVQGEYVDKIILTQQFYVKASRLMPFYGVPTI